MNFLISFAHHNPFGAAMCIMVAFVLILAAITDKPARRW